jgi:molybdopterin-guanine dinucleotide biosynthesis protein A
MSVALPAVILAGGRASRMGGGDKTLLMLGDRRIIDHIIARLAPQANPVAINANGDPTRFASCGTPVLADSFTGFAGPLAGILAAMDWAAARGADGVLTVAGDTPFLPPDLMTTLMAHAAADCPCLAATRLTTGALQPQPTVGLWPTSLRHQLRADLHSGIRKVRQWTMAQNATFAPFDDDGRVFFNINTPDDLGAAQAMLVPLVDATHDV